MAIEKGKLVRWIDDKGFGFIKPENASNEIFIHISALKGMSRKPVVGDVIQYQIGFDKSGKTRAVDAKIEGVSSVLTLLPLEQKREKNISRQANARTHRNLSYKVGNPQKSSAIFPIFSVIALMVLIYGQFSKEQISNDVDTAKRPVAESRPFEQSTQFQCRGKIWCSQMSSYEEALFYLQNCPGTKMDGDGDGVPCERQFGMN